MGSKCALMTFLDCRACAPRTCAPGHLLLFCDLGQTPL